MKKVNRYDTSIDNLYDTYIKNNNAIFISNWDIDYDLIDCNANLINKINENSIADNNIFKYYFWTDDFKIKKIFCDFLKNIYNEVILEDNVTITSNGTSSLFLSLIVLRKKIKNVCVLSPNYFTTINVLFDLNFKVYNEQIIESNAYKLNVNFAREVVENNIELILVSNPLFGTGYEIFNIFNEEIIKLINERQIIVLCDNMYGGMNWKQNIEVFDINSYRNIVKFKKYIFLESPSKRVFLNGAKFCTLISNIKAFNSYLESLSVNYIGSMSALQISSYKEIYNPQNHVTIINNINKNMSIAKKNYLLLCSFFDNTQIKVLYCESGYFCLLSLQKNDLDDNEISMFILKNYNILTIPHSRYLLNDSINYYFRINLLIDISQTIYYFSKLLKK